MKPDMDWYFFIDADTYLLCMCIYFILEFNLNFLLMRDGRTASDPSQQLPSSRLQRPDLSSDRL